MKVARAFFGRRLCALIGAGLAMGACSSEPADRPARELHVLIPSDDGRVLGATLLLPPVSSSPARVSSGSSMPASALVSTTVRDSAAAGRAPAVLLIGGSGPQDRDGTRADVPGYAPLRQIAEYLARDGFAVLRVDDRGIGASTGSFVGATTADFAADAAHAVAWLRQRREIDTAHVALVGHSEGALVAMLVAAHDHTLRTMVLMGAPARTGRDVARWQRASLVASDPATWPSTERAAVLANAEREAERAAAHDPWLHTWFTLDPRLLARSAPLPALLLHGETDRQVPSTQADELADALRDAGAADVSVRRFPSTNHLFLEDANGDPRGYGQLATRAIRGDVLHEIRAWLRAHSTRE